jgi:hypothetical protein
VLVIILLVALLVVLAVVGLMIWIRRAAACGRTIDVPATEPVQRFAGDTMCKSVVTSGSFARLEAHDWGIRIRGLAPYRWIVPTWEARYSELALVELVASKSRIAVWLRLRGEPGGMGFLTTRSRDILKLLEEHQVQVSQEPAQPRRLADLYGPR